MLFCTKLAKREYLCYNKNGGEGKNESKNI